MNNDCVYYILIVFIPGWFYKSQPENGAICA